MYIVIKRDITILLLLIYTTFFCQTRIVRWGENKYYKVYEGFAAANNVLIDSVEGLSLISNNFKDFPKEILKFKNLKYIEIGSYSLFEALDSLSDEQRIEYENYKLKYPLSYTIEGSFKPNKIKKIPKNIKKLTKLEAIDFLTAEICNKRKFKKIYEYLPIPKTEIIPSKEFLEDNY